MFAPTVSFGQIACGWLMSFGQVTRGMGDFVWGGLRVGGSWRLGGLRVDGWFRLCGIAWKNMMEMGRGGACVPARVALQGRIHR